MAVLAYAAERYPEVERHLAVQAPATNAVAVYEPQRQLLGYSVYNA